MIRKTICQIDSFPYFASNYIVGSHWNCIHEVIIKIRHSFSLSDFIRNCDTAWRTFSCTTPPPHKCFRSILAFFSFDVISIFPQPSIQGLTFTTLWANSAENKLVIFFLFFSRKQDLTFHTNCLLWNVKTYFLGKIRKMFQNIICLKF